MDTTQEAIVKSLKDLPFPIDKFTDDDILILSEWGRTLYNQGWNTAKRTYATLDKLKKTSKTNKT